MNGDKLLLCPKTINIPIKISMIITGASHQAFLSFINAHISPNKDLFFTI